MPENYLSLVTASNAFQSTFFLLQPFTQMIVDWVTSFMETNKKVAPLLKISQPLAFVEKARVERKLLSSLINELAKSFGSDYPVSMSPYRRKAFDAMWSFFDNFRQFEQYPCVYKDNNSVGFNTMCYHMFTTAVSATYNRLKNKLK